MEVNNKVLVNIIVPEINQKYDVYLPVNKKIGSIIQLLNKSIKEINNEDIFFKHLYNEETKELYNYDILLINSKRRNGSKLVLLR